MKDKLKTFLPYLSALTVVIFWASGFPITRYLVLHLAPGSAMLLRFLIASLALVVYCVIKKVPLPKRKDLPLIVLSGFIGIFLFMWGVGTGAKTVEAGTSSFIISFSPIFVLLYSIFVDKKKISKTSILGMILSLFGLFLIAYSKTRSLTFNLGLLVLIGSSLSAGIFTITQHKLSSTYSAIQMSTYAVCSATLFMFIFAPTAIFEIPNAPPLAILCIVYLGLFPAALAYFLWGYAISHAKNVVTVASFNYLIPFFATLMAYFWIGEKLSLISLLGGVTIIVGMIISNFKNSKINDRLENERN